MKALCFGRILVLWALIFAFLTIFPAIIPAAEDYKFKRMWPVLQQPWYFSDHRGIAVDAVGNVYITGELRIQKFAANGEFITEWGSWGRENGQFMGAYGIALDSTNNVYVTDTYNNRVQKFTSDGQFIKTWGSEGTSSGAFSAPLGIAVDINDHVYVADINNNRIQKFTSEGQYMIQWGSKGGGNGQFDWPGDMVIGSEGFLMEKYNGGNVLGIDSSGYVYVADINNCRIQKFTSSGQFVSKWGSFGVGDGEFQYPLSVCVDNSDNIYIADRYRNDIQKFSSNGNFIAKWGRQGRGEGQFSYPEGMVVDDEDHIFVSDYWNSRIEKFTLKGDFVTQWGSAGTDNGWFNKPTGIALGNDGSIYVAEWFNHRIQRFSSDGQFIAKWGDYGNGNGQFKFPGGVAFDGLGNLYVADSDNHRVQKFTSAGQFITTWGSNGDGDGQFNSPSGITVGSNNYVYVVDSWNHRVQVFTLDGQFIGKWGKHGSGNGEFDFRFDDWRGMNGIATDSAGNVYVADIFNYRMQKFTSDGLFITKWGTRGGGSNQFYRPIGVAVDSNNNIYVVDGDKDTIQKFTSGGQFIVEIGQYGNSFGQLDTPNFLAIDSQGDLYVTEGRNNRVQVFSTDDPPGSNNRKAVIVAGSGPYAANTLWNATQMCANYAYRALSFQGYDRDAIYYLSADTDLDLDNDGYVDVDGDATNTNLEYALKTWGLDADSLFVYLVGHGGSGTFRMGEFELLNYTDLDASLDTLQRTIPGYVTVLNDSCYSGSFVSTLAPPQGKERVVVSSASTNEPAIFQADGGLSFGFQFFAFLFNGGSFYDSFLHGKKSVEGTYDFGQNPQIEGNGNGITNEKADKDIARGIKISNETPTGGDIPSIESVSPDQTLPEGKTSAPIYAQNVVDADGIQEVFAVIKPPNYSSGSPDNPVTNLPTMNLPPAGESRYEGTYKDFTVVGAYNIAVFARDGKGVLSLPIQTTVTVTNGCLAVAGDLSIWVPCAEYNGTRYGFTLNFYSNPDDSSSYYWNLDMATLTDGTGNDCISIGSDLSMPIPCAAYNGVQYGFTLKFYNNSYDPSGLYWKMDMSTLKVK